MPLTRPKASQIDFSVTNISDPLIRLNSAESGSADKDTGIVMERGSDGNVALIYDESEDQFALINTNETGTTSGNITISSYADLTLKRVTQSEQQYTTSNMMKFNQYYLGNAIGSYLDPNEYQKVLTITPAGNSENYQVSGRIMAQNAGDIHIVYFTAALRSGDPLPDLSWTISYTEEYNGSRYIDPQLWTKETSTAGFIVAFKVLSRIFGTVTVDIDVIPRSSGLKANVAMNTSVSSEQTTIDTGFTANDMTKVSTTSGTSITHVGSLTASSLAYPTSDGSANQVLQTDGSGTLSFADASGGATVSSDTTTNAERLIYVGSTTTGTLSAVTQDSGLTYNPSTGTLTSSVFAGEATSAKYADLAERYQADAEYLPGTVLIFGGDAEVTQSTERMDRRAAGVVSTDPAYLMNSSLVGKNTVTLALTGRVPCKVSGYVRKGDLMISGVDHGVAEAWREESSPPAGSIIGKSLEDKDSRGIDVIEVVIGAK